jgi:hypothetical protein
MLLPSVLTWTKKPNHLIRHRINARHIRAFVNVAGKTRPGQILQHREATMFLRDDVIDVER